jgi:hypothetical protein
MSNSCSKKNVILQKSSEKITLYMVYPHFYFYSDAILLRMILITVIIYRDKINDLSNTELIVWLLVMFILKNILNYYVSDISIRFANIVYK